MSKPEVDDGFVAKQELLFAVIDSDWATKLDMKVARRVIHRYMRQHKNARVSLRYLEQATGATRPNVITSLRHLCTQGIFTVLREGRGTRPTEYLLNFDYPVKSASGIVHNTSTSGIVGNTSSGIVHNTSSASSGIVGNTEFHLHNPVTLTGLLEDGTASGSTPAPAAGDGAAVADARLPAPAPAAGAPTTQHEKHTSSPFEDLWAAWGNKREKHKAKAAYAKLKPDAALHERLVALAVAWTDNYSAIGVEKRFQTSLGNWLERERFDEDLPIAFADPREAAISRARANGKAKPKNSGAEPGKHGHNIPRGANVLTIDNAEIIGSQFDVLIIKLSLTGKDGTAYTHEFVNAHPTDETLADAGRRHVSRLCHALTNGMLTGTDDWIGKQVLVTVARNGTLEYSSAGHSFDTPSPAKPLSSGVTATSPDIDEHDIPRGRRQLTIADIDEADDGVIEMRLTDWDGATYSHEFSSGQAHGQDILERILESANGGNRPEKLTALVGLTVETIVNGEGELRYLTAT